MPYIGDYYVAVQWGSGHHYFLGGPRKYNNALDFARSHAQSLQKRQGRRGALPTVRAVHVVEEHKITRPPKEAA